MRWLLPVLFITYYSGISLFMHVHIEEGTTIVHSHPFKRTADGTCHHHSSLAEIQFFHILSSVDVMDGAIRPLTLHFYAPHVLDLIEAPVLMGQIAPVEGARHLRAPPVFDIS